MTQLRRRGARVVGKTNLDEFGMGSHSLFSHFGGTYQRVSDKGPSLHGLDKSDSGRSSGDGLPADSLSVGGSSGGSAVAVRLGDADVALGTDTGGSVRLPAAYGGVVGFKPSYGMLSRFGVVPYANSLDTVGLLAPTVAPIRRLIVGAGSSERSEQNNERSEDPKSEEAGGLWRESDVGRDPTSLTLASRLRIAGERSGYDDKEAATNLRGITFGIPLEYNIEELDPRIRTAWAAAAERLRGLGATIAAVSLPSTRHALSAYYVLAPAEAASNLARYDGVRYGQVGDLGEVEAGEISPAEESEEGDEADLYERVRGAGLGREVQRRILLGNYVLSSSARDNYFVQAQRVRRVIVRDFDAVFRLPNPLRDHKPVGEQGVYKGAEESHDHINLSDLPEGLPLADKRGPAQVDFLLCPTAPTPAPRLEDVEAAPSPVDAYINDVFTVPASLAGLPAISIPMPAADTGAATEADAFCPGFQLIGQFFDDARLLKVAETVMTAAFERPEDVEALEKHRKTGVSMAA